MEKLEIEWTDDCQGKKDYDGRLVVVSTRYWPAGGGWHVFDTRQPEKGLHEVRDPTIKASATSSILLARGDLNGTYEELIEKDFEGENFEAIAPQVEQWAAEQYEKIAIVLRAAFGQGKTAEVPNAK